MPLVDDALSGYSKNQDADGTPPVTGLRLAAQRVLGFFDSVIGGAATLALIALILIVLANVIGRYGFNASLTWGGEAAQWLFIGVIFLAVPLAHRGRAHLSIQFLVERLPTPLQTVAGFLSDLIIAYATVMLLLGGMTLIDVVGGVNYALNLPSWVKFALIPVTSALGLLYLALQGLDEGKRPWRGVISIALAFGLYFLLPLVGARTW